MSKKFKTHILLKIFEIYLINANNLHFFISLRTLITSKFNCIRAVISSINGSIRFSLYLLRMFGYSAIIRYEL